MSNELAPIPYHTMAARAEWLRARMAESAEAGATYKAVGIIVAVLCVGAILAAFAHAAMLILGGQAASASEYFLITQANQVILQIALALVGVTAIPALALVVLQPTHLLLTKEGISFGAHGTPLHLTRNSIPWQEIESIECVQQPGKAGDTLVVHGANKQRLFIRLSNLSQDDRLRLLDGIKTHAPLAVQEPAVLRALTTSRDQTYTEIWLQAFASPPKHENMLPLRAGAVLSDGKYEVEHQLGAGGLGTAYLARDRQQAKVVLKEFILPVYVDAAICRQALKAFEAEARILKGLDHPNIVRLFDFFVQDQRAYMVLEYIDGPSLKLYVQQQGQPLPAKDAVKFALQICEALSHLHAQSPPVVHRDVTPDNLILSRDGTIKLIDFNVAQQAETNTTAIFVGKPGYLPPEQFRGEPSVHSDIFAAGASLHFLLTGKDPIALTVSRPKLIQHAVPAPLDDIVAKATALDIKDRYTSVEEFKQALLAQQ